MLALRDKLKRLDPAGVVLLLGSVSCLLVALQWGGDKYPWHSSQVIGLFIGFGLLLIIFGGVQWYMDEAATIPLRLLSQRNVLFGSLASCLMSMSANTKLYYMPFFFQAVLGSSTIRSGIDFLPLAVPQVVATIISGVLVTKTGSYIPIILSGLVVTVLGNGLLISLTPTTTTAAWATFMVIAGFGDGWAVNIPYIAIQAILENEEDVFIGNAIATFFTLLGGAIAISLSNTLLLNGLLSYVPMYEPSLSAHLVAKTGALDISRLAPAPAILANLRKAYAKAISHTNIFGTVAVGLAVIVAAFMEWKNLQRVAHEREAATASATSESSSNAGNDIAEGQVRVEKGWDLEWEDEKRDTVYNTVDTQNEKGLMKVRLESGEFSPVWVDRYSRRYALGQHNHNRRSRMTRNIAAAAAFPAGTPRPDSTDMRQSWFGRRSGTIFETSPPLPPPAPPTLQGPRPNILGIRAGSSSIGGRMSSRYSGRYDWTRQGPGSGDDDHGRETARGGDQKWRWSQVFLERPVSVYSIGSAGYGYGGRPASSTWSQGPGSSPSRTQSRSRSRRQSQYQPPRRERWGHDVVENDENGEERCGEDREPVSPRFARGDISRGEEEPLGGNGRDTDTWQGSSAGISEAGGFF